MGCAEDHSVNSGCKLPASDGNGSLGETGEIHVQDGADRPAIFQLEKAVDFRERSRIFEVLREQDFGQRHGLVFLIQGLQLVQGVAVSQRTQLPDTVPVLLNERNRGKGTGVRSNYSTILFSLVFAAAPSASSA